MLNLHVNQSTPCFVGPFCDFIWRTAGHMGDLRFVREVDVDGLLAKELAIVGISHKPNNLTVKILGMIHFLALLH